MRDYLGCSLVCHFCDKYIWMMYHWYNMPENVDTDTSKLITVYSNAQIAKKQRIFDVGYMFEDLAIGWANDARKNAKAVYDRQRSVVFASVFRGHIDGIIDIDDEPHLLEIKTFNNSRYNELERKGIPVEHRKQMQLYMYGLELDKGIHVGINKNNCEIHETLVEADKDLAVALIHKGINIIHDNLTPPKPSYCTSTFFKCKMCDFYNICFGDEKPAKNCRTCKHAESTLKGFYCSKNSEYLPTYMQPKGCDQWV